MSEALNQSAILHLTIDQLHASEQNVRHTPTSPDSDAELTASLLSLGMLQPMVVIPHGAGGYEVIAGGRRRRLLAALAEADPRRKDMTFPCVLGDASKAAEISLAENRARAAMSLPDVYEAWAAIRAERPDATYEELGAIFGYDVARVARIMRLANLHPEIMARYRVGEISDAQAQAYAATGDQSLQIAVYRQLEETASYPHEKGASAIRSAMGSGIHELTKLIRYVGVEPYRAAGGVFEADLFAEEGTGIVENPDLLRELAAQRLEADKDRYEHQLVRNGRKLGEKWGLAALEFSWAASPPQIKEHGYTTNDHALRIRDPQRGSLAKKQEQLYSEMETRVTSMIGEDDEPLPGLEQQYATLAAQLTEMDALRPIVLPKTGAVIGVASIDNNGNFDVELWFASRAAKGLDTPKGAKEKPAAKADLSPPEAERARFGLSKDNMQIMMLIRRDMIRNELIASASAGSSLALDFMLYSQARTILTPTRGYGSTVTFKGGHQGIDDLPHDEDGTSKIGVAVKTRFERAAWIASKDELAAAAWVTTPDPIEGFALFRQMPERYRHGIAGLIAGHMLQATTSVYSDGRTPRMVRELANQIEAEPGFGRWRDLIELDAEFFSMFSHRARLALLDAWGLSDRAKGMKASESAAFCARIANCSEVDQKLFGLDPDDVAEVVNWLPDFMQGGAVAPLPVIDQEPDNEQDEDTDLDDDHQDDDDPSVNDNHADEIDADDMDEAA